MRIAYAGTPDFAVPTLKALVAAGHDVAAVLTQPDRRAGRGRRMLSPPVKDCARALGLEVLQPQSLKDRAVLDELRGLRLQAIVVAAYGLILPRSVLELPEHGCLNVHASLLPRWRGAAPIQRAIEAGDAETGITIMRMAEGLDTGPILAQRATPISARDTAGALHDRLALMGAELMVETLERLERGDVEARPQDERLATYAPKLDPAEAVIDWSRPAVEIERRVRAMNPWPVARTSRGGQVIRIWEAAVADGASGEPGEILRTGRDGVEVACGENGLRLAVLQREGGRPLAAAEFLNGFPLSPGERFDSGRR
ncbi:MAG TPA: methionyl-tRNA formyltransferase [Arenicellales bacterium]|nr:methionyl-tRNA formyltransferase [Arenicellales bacterium]